MKTGLNQYFNKWVNDIQWAYKTTPIYEKKIKYYKERLNSCKTQVFDTIGGTKTFDNKEEEQLIDILDKLEVYKKKLEENWKLIRQANDFFDEHLIGNEKFFYIKFVSENLSKAQIAREENYSRSYISKVFKKIERKYWEHVVCYNDLK